MREFREKLMCSSVEVYAIAATVRFYTATPTGKAARKLRSAEWHPWVDERDGSVFSIEHRENESHQMQPLYAVRASDLKPGDLVIVECASCGHDGLIHPTAFPSLGLRPDDRVVDLAARLRCRECDAKGRSVVSIRWGTSEAPPLREGP